MNQKNSPTTLPQPRYEITSRNADEFIHHQEILDTLDEARAHSHDRAQIERILDKAALAGGLTHREAALLLECPFPDLTERLFALAKQIKEKLYGKRIVIFAPLYLSNHCVNGCTYCPYHAKNRTIPRKKLSQEEIRREVIALQDMGHKRLALEAGEHPTLNPIDYILESIRTIYSIHHRNGAIRRVNVNIAATTIENYRLLKEAGIGTYILFQETYHKAHYRQLHPTGPKSDYAWHTQAMDRAMEGGIDDVGIGVLFGLNTYRYDFVGLLMHAEHLEATFGVGPHTISVPRICPADDIDTNDFPNSIDDDTFARIVAVIRLAVPYTGMIISTRESEAVRRRVLELGISQISGGSRTSVGGYAQPETQGESSAQFEVSDRRTLDQVVGWLLSLGHIPSFCTACYRQGRTGDRFMSLVKRGQIANCCQPNALMTLKEYLMDYASPDTLQKGIRLIEEELIQIPSQRIRTIAARNLQEIEAGKRDFRF
jgi:2-iminoacetate synthase